MKKLYLVNGKTFGSKKEAKKREQNLKALNIRPKLQTMASTKGGLKIRCA